MKNTYYVELWNDSCIFDSGNFTNLKVAKSWAAGRGSNYSTRIYVNGAEEPSISYKNK